MIRVNIVQNFNVENNIFRIFFSKSTNWFVFFCIWCIFDWIDVNKWWHNWFFVRYIYYTFHEKFIEQQNWKKKNHWREKFETKTWKISQKIFRTMRIVLCRFKSFFEKRFKLTHVLISSIEKFHICKKKNHLFRINCEICSTTRSYCWKFCCLTRDDVKLIVWIFQMNR